MNNEKLENQLNLALDVPEQTRDKTADLDIGFNQQTKTWELIVKYSGSLQRIMDELNISVVELMNEYAIITIPENLIYQLANYEEIEFVEKPKQLFFAVSEGKAASCIPPVQIPNYNLFGEGILVAVIDSGIDYSHPDFRNEDGTTRIVDLWDQTIQGKPPIGYDIGTQYTKEQINEALKNRNRGEQLNIVPSVDSSGHGTHVAGIACGNGRASKGRNRGVASKSELLIVKLGNSVGESFPRTTRLMEAIDFVIKRAIELKKPLAINISFGNNYGSHDGNSLLETYINDMVNRWKISIVIGSGNEGSASHHAEGIIQNNITQLVEFSIAPNEPSLSLQLWKNYYDEFDIIITAPGGTSAGPISKILGTQQFVIEGTNLLIYYGEPTPYSILQEIYFEFIPAGMESFITSGIWTLSLVPKRIVTGNYDMWFPSSEIIGKNTKFLIPSVYRTLTIPSTAQRAITVAGYNSRTDSFAYFSGRGYTRNNQIKPDIAAPAVDILSAAPNGGYTVRTGTSMATPFVTGSCALMMEWGIVKGNDLYLYGEKIKSYLIKGAKHLPGFEEWPNPSVGWGSLCLRNSFPF